MRSSTQHDLSAPAPPAAWICRHGEMIPRIAAAAMLTAMTTCDPHIPIPAGVPPARPNQRCADCPTVQVSTQVRPDMAFGRTKGGKPMGVTPAYPADREPDGGDRVRIRRGRRLLRPDLVGQVGTIVEVFRVPQGSCLVRVDGDPNRQREWFLYRDEIVISDA
jgi:hypothetical protein